MRPPTLQASEQRTATCWATSHSLLRCRSVERSSSPSGNSLVRLLGRCCVVGITASLGIGLMPQSRRLFGVGAVSAQQIKSHQSCHHTVGGSAGPIRRLMCSPGRELGFTRPTLSTHRVLPQVGRSGGKVVPAPADFFCLQTATRKGWLHGPERPCRELLI